MVDFIVGAVVVCDDVRKEITSKDILIGVYRGGILASHLPATIPLAIWIELTPESRGHVEVDVKMTFPGVPGPIDLTLMGEVPSSETTSVNTPQIVCTIAAEGNIEISVKPRSSSDWTVVKTKSVRLAAPQQPPMPMEAHIGPPPEATSPTALPPPSEQSPPDAQTTKSRARRRSSTRRSGQTPEPE